MRKVTAIAATALIAAAIAVPMTAGAQEDATTDTTTFDSTTTDSTETYRRGGGAKFETIAATIGITFDELRAQIAEGRTIAEIAEANGVSASTVAEALIAEMESHIADHLASGDITQEQADLRLGAADERVDDLLNGTLPAHGRFGEAFGEGRRGLGGPLAMSSTLPDLLGIHATELKTQLQGGATVAEVAGANGVPVDDVINGLVEAATERLNTAVAEGNITQDHADEELAEMTERITAMVNGEAPLGRGGFGRHEGGQQGGHDGQHRGGPGERGFGFGHVDETVDA